MGRLGDLFVSGKPFVVIESDLKAAWMGGENGKHFRCQLCGYKFIIGDTARMQYTNDTPEAYGNPLICKKCDGTKEEIVAKLRARNIEFKSEKFWYNRHCLGEE